MPDAMPKPSKIAVHPITSAVGAVIEGVDLRQALAADDAAAVRQAWLEHGVLFFRDQDVTLEQFWAFMERFGQPQKEEVTGTDRDKATDVQTADMAPVRHTTAVWHADTTSMAQPPMATALRAVNVPRFGGDTCWSSMYAAYAALSEPMQRMLDALTAVHSIEPTYDRMKSYAQYFVAKYSERHAAEQVHPVVLTHPETGRKALYVSESFTTRIVELSPAESRSVLDMLFRHIGSPCFSMRWKWSANDVAIWDNRCVQHFAVPDYESTRTMQRIVLAGVRPGGPALEKRIEIDPHSDIR
jgi:alpha-ketoglutarate-dependent taurine dioxygenase